MVPIIRFCINTCIKCHKTFKTLPFLMNMSLCSWIISTCKKVEASFDIKHRWPSCNTSLPPLEEVSKTSYFSFITWEMNFCPLIIKGDLRPNFTCFFFSYLCYCYGERTLYYVLWHFDHFSQSYEVGNFWIWWKWHNSCKFTCCFMRIFCLLIYLLKELSAKFYGDFRCKVVQLYLIFRLIHCNP